MIQNQEEDMRRGKALPLCAVLLAAAWCMAAAKATDPDAESAVRRIAEQYRQFDSYKFEYLDSYTNAGTYHRKVSFQRPGQYRVENNRAGEANWVIQISTGRTVGCTHLTFSNTSSCARKLKATLLSRLDRSAASPHR
jgi:outer membrane lipoprotein-sorting protein